MTFKITDKPTTFMALAVLGAVAYLFWKESNKKGFAQEGRRYYGNYNPERRQTPYWDNPSRFGEPQWIDGWQTGGNITSS